MARAIPPSFEPGSGWYQPSGQWAPGSLRDQEARILAAWPCTVVVLYRNGTRIPAADLLKADQRSGSLLCSSRYTHPHWHACLLSDPAVESDMLPRLLHARLERENEGVRLYGGIEVADHGREQWRQAWLCTQNERRLREILATMMEREAQGG